ncbi:hypothetical protein HPB51_023993 [Rhipicephalus microplus]|uniref:Secreted protein n=1 Tax=Rhipicephalus microplus TaxID=6941 RepID=A0A9J6EDX7_RHIMP|nr:hypothetical protein HPB51_023993 [Rhipicephalus microplus]
MGAMSAAAVLGMTVLLCFTACSRANVDVDEHIDDKLLNTLIKTRDSRSFLSDLIFKIQLLLNDTDDPQQHTTLATPKSAAIHWSIEVMAPSTGEMSLGSSATVSGSPSSNDNGSSSNKSKNSSTSSSSSVLSSVRQQQPQKQSQKESRKHV